MAVTSWKCLSAPLPDSPQQYEEGKKRRSPNYSSVDLSEVEWEDRDDVVSGLWPVVWQVHCTRSQACRRPQELMGGPRPPEGCGGHDSCTCLQLYDSTPCLLCAVCWRRPLHGLVPPPQQVNPAPPQGRPGPCRPRGPGSNLAGQQEALPTAVRARTRLRACPGCSLCLRRAAQGSTAPFLPPRGPPLRPGRTASAPLRTQTGLRHCGQALLMPAAEPCQSSDSFPIKSDLPDAAACVRIQADCPGLERASPGAPAGPGSPLPEVSRLPSPAPGPL